MVCTICGEPLDDGRPVQYDLDGEGAHMECVDLADPDEGEDDD